MACSTCGGSVQRVVANTGREERLPDWAFDLRRYEIALHDDFRECSACGDLFAWVDTAAWTGSGSDDEEILTRLAPDDGAVVRGAVRRGSETAADVDERLGDALIALPELPRRLVFAHLSRCDRDLLHALLPRVVVALARTNQRFFHDVLLGAAYDRRLARTVVELAERTPHGDAAQLIENVVSVARRHAGVADV